MEDPQALQHSYEEPPPPLRDENAPPITDEGSAPPAPVEKWSRTIHPRGRQARDPLAQSVTYEVTNLETMKEMLRDYLTTPTGPAEHTTVEFRFPTSAAFMAYTADLMGLREAHKARADVYNTMKRTAISVIDALNQPDPKDQMRKQKAIAKSIVEAISEVDGFRYSFHNNWLSKEDEACRFSYYCNDSTLNKGRAANEGAGMEGKKKVKPVYDCQGLIWVKFSITKNNLEIQYKHIPLHKTYEERAPPPRRDSKRRKMMELFTPEKLVKQGQKRTGRPKGALDNPDKPRKRRATEPPRVEADGADEGRDEGLAPLMDFLGSVDKDGSGAPEQVIEGTDPRLQAQTNSEPPMFPAEKIQQLKDKPLRTQKAPKEPKAPRPKKPSLPGMMSGYMAGDLITWGEKERRGSRNASAPQATPTGEPLAGIADAAAEAGPSEPPSELDLLKAKLAAAEARINNLEAEKTRPFGPPGWPPTAQPSQPQQYNYPPPPPYGHYHTPQYQQPQPSMSTQSSAGAAPAYGPPPTASVESAGASPVAQNIPAKASKSAPKKTRSSAGGVNGQAT